MLSPWQLRFADFWGSMSATVALAILRGELYGTTEEREFARYDPVRIRSMLRRHYTECDNDQ